MLTILIRTFVIYFSLLFFMRSMGKRQVGELEISEFVSTLLLSEIVSVPIENSDSPVISALVPMLIIISLEIILSFAITKCEFAKKLLSGKPSVLISKGKLDISELERSRMSVEELMSELRQKGIGDINEVNYAILEQNGQFSVIQKKSSSKQNESGKDTGLSHLLIVDGAVKEASLQSSGCTRAWLNKYLLDRSVDIHDIFLFIINDAGHIDIILKSDIENAQEAE